MLAGQPQREQEVKMAVQQGLVSVQLADATGVVGAFDQPFIYDDATTTLANLIAAMQGMATQIDGVSEARLNKLRMTLDVALPSGINVAKPVAGSDLEETGLITFSVNGNIYNYGVDVPGYLQSEFTGKNIPISGSGPSVNLENFLIATATGGIKWTDKGKFQLFAPIRARKTFRKHRRALQRA